MLQAVQFTKISDQLFDRELDQLESWYSREDFEAALKRLKRAPADAKRSRRKEWENLCDARGLDAEALLKDEALLQEIPTREQIRENLLDGFHEMYQSFPRGTNFMERIVCRLAPEYADDTVRVAILKKFLAGSDASFKCYQTEEIWRWAEDQLTQEEQEAWGGLTAEQKKTLLISKVTEDIFAQMPHADDLSAEEFLRFIAARLENYKERMARLNRQIACVEKLLPADDAARPVREQLEILKEKADGADWPENLKEDELYSLLLLMQLLRADGKHGLSLDEPIFSADTMQKMAAFLKQNGVEAAESTGAGMLRQCAQAAADSQIPGQEMELRVGQFVYDIDRELTRKLKKIPRISNRNKPGSFNEIYVQDQKDALKKKKSELKLLKVCDDLAGSMFRVNGITKMQLYHFAFMFGMNFGRGDAQRDIEQNLFYDLYSNSLMRVLDQGFEKDTTIEKWPTGEGINYKSYVECIYLYFLHHEELGRTPGKRIDLAEAMINSCVRKAQDLEKENHGAAGALPRMDKPTQIYKTGIFEELLKKKKKELPDFIVTHYQVLSPETAGKNRICTAATENTAVRKMKECQEKWDALNMGYFDPASENEYAHVSGETFFWSLRKQLEERFPSEEDEAFRRVVAELEKRARDERGRYSRLMRWLMLEVLHVLVPKQGETPFVPQETEKIHKKLSADLRQALKEAKEAADDEPKADGDTAALKNTVRNAVKLLQSLGFDIRRARIVMCTPPNKKPKAGEWEEALKALNEQTDALTRILKSAGYESSTVYVGVNKETRRIIGTRPYEEESSGEQLKKKLQPLAEQGWTFRGLNDEEPEDEEPDDEEEAEGDGRPDADTAAKSAGRAKLDGFCLGSLEYSDADLQMLIDRFRSAYILDMDQWITYLTGVLIERRADRIARTDLMAMHFNWFVRSGSLEHFDSFRAAYEEYADSVNELLEDARYQKLSSRNIFDMFLVNELYCNLLSSQ